jgi:hypothetical protein
VHRNLDPAVGGCDAELRDAATFMDPEQDALARRSQRQDSVDASRSEEVDVGRDGVFVERATLVPAPRSMPRL